MSRPSDSANPDLPPIDHALHRAHIEVHDYEKPKRDRTHYLYVSVIIAMILGVAVGAIWPKVGVELKPLGTIFVNLIKMMISPIIFCTIVTGIAGMQSTKKVGRVGLKAILYFEVVTTLALVIGLIVINVMKPGTGMNIDTATLDTKAVESYITEGKSQSVTDFILHIIPENIINALSNGSILQVLFFSILLGFALSKIGEKAAPLLKGIQSLEDGLFAIIKMIMKLAPLGALGAMAFTIGKYGIGSLAQLGQLMIAFYITCLLFILLVLGSILKYTGFNIFRLLAYIKDELLVVLGTSSSEPALPSLMEKLERMGCSKSVVGLVVPAGYSFNLDGTTLYLSMCMLFLAQVFHVDLSLAQILSIIGILMLTSKGMAGVPRASLVVIAATLNQFDIPEAGLLLILGVDTFLDMGRSATNAVGNSIATAAVAKWEGELLSVEEAAAHEQRMDIEAGLHAHPIPGPDLA